MGRKLWHLMAGGNQELILRSCKLSLLIFKCLLSMSGDESWTGKWRCALFPGSISWDEHPLAFTSNPAMVPGQRTWVLTHPHDFAWKHRCCKRAKVTFNSSTPTPKLLWKVIWLLEIRNALFHHWFHKWSGHIINWGPYPLPVFSSTYPLVN